MWHDPDELRINQRNYRGDTPLHLAARYGYQALVAVLLQHGATIHVRNNRNETPLQCAHSPVRDARFVLLSHGTCGCHDTDRCPLPPLSEMNSPFFGKMIAGQLRASEENGLALLRAPMQNRRARTVSAAPSQNTLPPAHNGEGSTHDRFGEPNEATSESRRDSLDSHQRVRPCLGAELQSPCPPPVLDFILTALCPDRRASKHYNAATPS